MVAIGAETTALPSISRFDTYEERHVYECDDDLVSGKENGLGGLERSSGKIFTVSKFKS